MRESRETVRSMLHAYVEQFLDHIYDDVPDDEEDDSLGGIVIAAEIYPGDGEDRAVVPTYWSSNENPIWKRGFFEILADYHRVTHNLRTDDED